MRLRPRAESGVNGGARRGDENNDRTPPQSHPEAVGSGAWLITWEDAWEAESVQAGCEASYRHGRPCQRDAYAAGLRAIPKMSKTPYLTSLYLNEFFNFFK